MSGGSGAHIGRVLGTPGGGRDMWPGQSRERPGPVLSVGGKWPRVVQSLTASGPRDDESAGRNHPGVSFLGDKVIKV